MDIAERTLQLKKDFDNVYKKGQSSMVDESKIIEKTVSGEYIAVDDVSEIPHNVKVKLTSETLTDYSGVTVFVGRSENEITETLKANADGTVEGIKSTSPYMYMTTDNSNVTINATYHKSYGMQTEYDRFWDIYQDYGNRTDYGYAFAGIGWNDDNYKCKYPIVVKNSSPSIFQSCKITDTKDSITFDTAITGITPFYIASSLETIHEIVLNRDISFGEYAFRNCLKLKNIKISGNGKIISSVGFQQSTLLTKKSILSIFNALSSTVTGLTLTLSKTAVTNAFGSTTATEWTNLVATKTNWTISLI